MESATLNIQAGDTLSWEGLSREIRAHVIQREDGQLVAMTDETHGFFVRDIIRSKSLRVVNRTAEQVAAPSEPLTVETAPVLF